MKKSEFDQIIKDCPMIAPVFRLKEKSGQLKFCGLVNSAEEFYCDPRTGSMVHIITGMSYKGLGGSAFEFVEYRKIR